jgi:hypothetical protein
VTAVGVDIGPHDPSDFWPRGFESIDVWFTVFCSENQIEVLENAVSRHGSWEWLGVREDTLRRFIVLGLTAVGDGRDAPLRYDTEFWSGASSRDRCVRKLAHHVEIGEESFENAEFQLWFSEQLARTWQRTLAIRPRQLVVPLSPVKTS